MAEVEQSYEKFEFYKGVSAVNRWISNDLSAFYLEAMKDRLYCGDGGGVLKIIFQGLLRMLSPITPILVEEAWEHRPEWMKEENQIHPFHRKRDDPVIPEYLLEGIEEIGGDMKWLMKANAAIKTAQEEGRAEKRIGSSLESRAVLDVPPEAHELFERYKDELSATFVVSEVVLGVKEEGEGEWVFKAEFETKGGRGTAWVLPPRDEKCPRCWRYVAEKEDELCGRCEGVVDAASG